MSAHTPGPWKLGHINEYGNDDGADIYIDSPTHSGLASVVWRMECETSSPEKEANAALIAAAPELLAALREGRDFVEGCVPKDDDLLARLNAAIAKAEGSC